MAGEIHHPPRYAHTHKLLAIGWMNTPEPDEEAIFHHLVQRNAINMHHPAHASGIVYAGQPDQDLQERSGHGLKRLPVRHRRSIGSCLR
jgi:hypothetical protein